MLCNLGAAYTAFMGQEVVSETKKRVPAKAPPVPSGQTRGFSCSTRKDREHGCIAAVFLCVLETGQVPNLGHTR